MFLVFHEITGKGIENCYISVQIQQICQCLIAVFGERINFMIRAGRSSSYSNKAWLIPSALSCMFGDT